VDERTLAFLRELERADEAVSATLAELDELAAAVEEVRTGALELEALLIRLPAERERLASDLAEAEPAAAQARELLVQAEAEHADATARRDEERARVAARLEVRARDALRMAERRVDEVRREQAAVAAQVEAVDAEIPRLDERARTLAGALAVRPRLAAEAGSVPEPGLTGIAEWGTQARAALFVARGSLASEQDALIRQANELGSLVLGEPVAAWNAAAVARRVERAKRA
jgi:predicted  nucleic acid-binding Zn-ribbon protein